MWLGAMDTRIAAVISAGFLTFMDHMEHNHCMCWKFPGLRELVDFPDLYALIAPRPLQCQNGMKEPPSQFQVPLARRALKQVSITYKDFEKPKNLMLNVHEEGHVIDLPGLLYFFDKHLGAKNFGTKETPKYVTAEDKTYGWKVEDEINSGGASISFVRLTSQTWQGITWKHWLTVIRPDNIKNSKHSMLVIAGGRSSSKPPRKTAMHLSQIAIRTGTVVSVLNQVPNQPLFDNLREDGLISYTFVKYLESKDESWPCLLPMVKSTMRAMDTVQALMQKKHKQKIEKFFLTGASKRGWTTWLTAAMDHRVSAIAPMVIDTLKMGDQMKYQLKCWGKYSKQIGDYTEKGLPDQLSKPSAQKLLDIVDPYAYIENLKMPKLILIGTNDPYWPVDAVNLYFKDLKGKKYIHYVPNAGHGLGMQAVIAIANFYQTTAFSGFVVFIWL